MHQAPEQLIALNKTNLEAAFRFAEIALEGTERMLEEKIIEFNRHYVTALDTMVKTAPAGSEVAVAAVKSATAPAAEPGKKKAA